MRWTAHRPSECDWMADRIASRTLRSRGRGSGLVLGLMCCWRRCFRVCQYRTQFDYGSLMLSISNPAFVQVKGITFGTLCWRHAELRTALRVSLYDNHMYCLCNAVYQIIRRKTTASLVKFFAGSATHSLLRDIVKNGISPKTNTPAEYVLPRVGTHRRKTRKQERRSDVYERLLAPHTRRIKPGGHKTT